MKHKARKWFTFSIRWGIAIAGIWWVLSKTPFHDQLIFVAGNGKLVRAQVLNEPAEDAPQFKVYDKATGTTQTIARSHVWTQPDESSVKAELEGKLQKAKLLAIRPGAHHTPGEAPAELLVADPSTGKPVRITPAQIPGGYHVRVPYPLIDIGVVRLVKHARLGYLLAALMVLPFSYL